MNAPATEFNPSIIIPVYNHASTITHTVNVILESTNLPVFLINDGSDTTCTQTLKQLVAQHQNRVFLSKHPHNMGKGAAIQTGFHVAQQHGHSHVLQVDADGQHQLSDINAFIKASQNQPTAIICGCPIYDDTVPKHRLYARYLTHIWVWINTLSMRIQDSMCGFRVYPLSSLVPLVKKYRMFPRMSFETELLVRADWARIPIINVPTRVHYPENGVSHFLSIKDNVYISLMHTKMFFCMLPRAPQLLYRFFTDPKKM